MANPTLFYDPLNGNDSNSGTTKALAKKNFYTSDVSATGPSIANQWRRGSNIMIARGTYWSPIGTTFGWDSFMSSQVGQWVDTYDAGYGSAPPILDCGYYEPSGSTGWTDMGDGRWQKTFSGQGFNQFQRAWAGRNLITDPLNTNTFKRMTSAALVLSTYQIHFSSLTVTIYTGTAQNPPAFYNGLYFTGSPAASGSGMWVTFGNNLTGKQSIRNSIDFRGTGIFLDAVNSTGFWMIKPIIQCHVAQSIFYNGSLSGITHRDHKVLQPYINYWTSANENQGASDFGTYGAQNGISAVPTAANTVVQNLEVVNPIVIGPRHSGFDIQVGSSGSVDSVRGIVIRSTPNFGSYVDCSSIDYGRMCSLGAVGFHLDGVHSKGAPTQSQIQGIGRLVNVNWTAMRNSGTQQNNEGTANALVIASQNTPTARYSTTNIDVRNILVDNPYNYSIVLSDTSTGGFPVNSVRIDGATVIDVAHYNEKTTIQEPSNKWALPSATIFAFAPSYFATPRFPTVRNSIFILPNGATSVFSHGDGVGPVHASGLSKYRTTEYTLNSETAPVVPKTNVQGENKAGLSLTGVYYTPKATASYVESGTHIAYVKDPLGNFKPHYPTPGRSEP